MRYKSGKYSICISSNYPNKLVSEKELCRPKAATPNEGFIVPNLDLTPLCSAKFKSGPPSDQAQVLTQLLADVIENSKCIDLKDLCIHPDKLAWCLYVDLICLDYDGSIIDASLISLIGALKSGIVMEKTKGTQQLNRYF